MAPRLPITAAPGSATTTTVSRDGEPLDPPPPQAPRRSGRHTAAPGTESRRLSGCAHTSVFVGYSRRPKQDESLMGPEISWCEQHCRGFWTVTYGEARRGEGQPMYFGFSDPDDAARFEAWQHRRRDSFAAPEHFE